MLDIKPIIEKDLPSLVRHINSFYSYYRNEEYFQWQLYKGIYPFILIGAYDDNKLIASLSAQKKLIDNSYLGAQINFIGVHKDYRGKKIINEIYKKMDHFLSDCDFIYVFCNADAKRFSEKTFEMKTYETPSFTYSYCSIMKSKKIKLRAASEIDLNITHYNKLINLSQSKGYFKWRYIDHPIHKYKYFINKYNDFAIIKKFNNPNNGLVTCDIVEVFVKNDVNVFFADLIKYFMYTEISYLSIWSNAIKILADFNFTKTEKNSYFGLSIKNPEFEYLYDIKKWNLQLNNAYNY